MIMEAFRLATLQVFMALRSEAFPIEGITEAPAVVSAHCGHKCYSSTAIADIQTLCSPITDSSYTAAERKHTQVYTIKVVNIQKHKTSGPFSTPASTATAARPAAHRHGRVRCRRL